MNVHDIGPQAYSEPYTFRLCRSQVNPEFRKRQI